MQRALAKNAIACTGCRWYLSSPVHISILLGNSTRHGAGFQQQVWAGRLQSSNAQNERRYIDGNFHTKHVAAAGEVQVLDFKQLTPFIKRIILRVHPDVVATAADEVVDTNASSLQDMFKLFDGLKAFCEADDISRMAGEPQLRSRSQLTFYHYEAVDTVDVSMRTLLRASVNVTVPGNLLERTRILSRRGLHAISRALWMEMAVMAVQQVAEAVGLKTGLALGDKHAAILRDMAENAKAGRESATGWSTAEAQLRENLLNVSPLEQGKMGAFPGIEGVDPDKEAPSVYTLTDRYRHVDQLLARPGAVTRLFGVHRIEGGHAATRLRKTMVNLHDPLQLYHAVWMSVTVQFGPATGGRGGYLAQPSTATLTLPADFNAQGFLSLVATHMPAIIKAHLQRGKKGSKEEEEAHKQQRSYSGAKGK